MTRHSGTVATTTLAYVFVHILGKVWLEATMYKYLEFMRYIIRHFYTI